MEFLGLLLISIGIMSLPFIFIRLYQGPGSVKFSFFNKSEKQKDRVHEMQDYVDKDKNIIAPTRAEILEKICQMTSIFRNITSSQLNITDAERTILIKKYLSGNYIFPITENADRSIVNNWLNNPATRALIKSIPIDCG